MNEELLFDTELVENTYLWCYKRLNNSHDSEDLSQEIILEAITSYRRMRKEGREPVSFHSWYWGIASNRLSLYYRARKNRAVLVAEFVGLSDTYDDLWDIDEELVGREERERLTYELSMLSAAHRESVIMYYLQNKSVKEISEALSLPEGTVKRRLFDARQSIRKGMENMSNTKTNRLSYAPAELSLFGSYGIPAYWNKLNDLLTTQILVSCAKEGKAVREISEDIGVAPVYFEDRINYLLENRFIKETSKGRYIDDFIIYPEQAWADYSGDKNRITAETMPKIHERIAEKLPEIRKLIANEKDFSDVYLLWIIYVYAAEALRNDMNSIYRRKCLYNVPKNNGKDYRLTGIVRYADETINYSEDYKSVSWSNLHNSYITSKYRICVANLFQHEPFGERDRLVNESNADLLMRIWDNSETELSENEKEKVSHLINKGIVTNKEGRLYLNIPVIKCRGGAETVVSLLEPCLEDIAEQCADAIVRVTDKYLLPYVREDLLEEYVNFTVPCAFYCVGELLWYGMYGGKTLAIPEDYEASAAGMALYIR